MPNIMPLEVVVVGAGFLVLCVFPALVTWADARTRRRSQAHEALVPSGEVHAPAAPMEGGMAPLESAPTADVRAGVSAAPEPIPSSTGLPGAGREGAALATAAVAVPDTPERAGDVLPLRVPEPVPVHPPRVGDPDSGVTCEFRLQDLRRARLLDWPPAAIRDNAERHRLWQEGMAMAAAHQARIDTMILRAPYLPQSACFGGAETAETGVRLRYFLFRDLWPVAESQAIAEAVFEVDATSDGLRSWLEPHQSAR